MEKNKLIISVLSAIAILGFLTAVYFATNQGGETTQTSQKALSQEVSKVKSDDHAKWSPAKKNVLIEYGDFQCPSCNALYTALKPFDASPSADVEITKKVTFVFRHFPLFQVHSHAYTSAYAAEAADRQGKFWEMYSFLFENQKAWSENKNPKDLFVAQADKLGLDVEKFKKDMDSKETHDRVERDLLSGNQAGVSSTPSLFLNGRRVEFDSIDELKNLLKETK